GDIGFTSDFSKVVMNLRNGEIHQLNVINYVNGYRRIKFENHRITLDAAGFGFHRSSDNALIRGDRELSARAMNSLIDTIIITQKRNRESVIESIRMDAVNFSNISFKDTVISQITDGKDSLKRSKLFDSLSFVRLSIVNKSGLLKSQKQIDTQTQKQIDTYEVEIYKKYSIPFACMIFALIGAPLGYRVKRGGFGIASGFSLLFFLIYWASLIGGEKLADRDLVSPFLGMWIVNIILGIFGLYLMFKSS
ncbi:MAG: lipopolysaccharide export system permease protein, partial [Bacteroidota bacterium]|nr:lipopolysaccharide export system permease protein [Bacteroidota bacterium]